MIQLRILDDVSEVGGTDIIGYVYEIDTVHNDVYVAQHDGKDGSWYKVDDLVVVARASEKERVKMRSGVDL